MQIDRQRIVHNVNVRCGNKSRVIRIMPLEPMRLGIGTRPLDITRSDRL
jgi:hypothetical protein